MGQTNEQRLLPGQCTSVYLIHRRISQHIKATIDQVTTMLATSKNVLFPGQVIITCTDNHRHWWPGTLIIALAPAKVIIKVKGHQYWWLACGYHLEIGHFRSGYSMVVTWWIVAFCTVIPIIHLHVFICICSAVLTWVLSRVDAFPPAKDSISTGDRRSLSLRWSRKAKWRVAWYTDWTKCF